MKALLVSEDILPLAEFKAHASEVFRKLRQSQRPLVITQNGRATAVLLTPEAFDRLTETAGFVAAVQEGLADAEAGRVIDDEALTEVLDQAFLAGPGR